MPGNESPSDFPVGYRDKTRDLSVEPVVMGITNTTAHSLSWTRTSRQPIAHRANMAGASDPLEDMLFSEVDEKAVSDLVGSLESQLVGQSDPAIAPPQSTQSGCGNTHSGSAKLQTGGKAQLAARLDAPSEPPQQQQQPPQQHGRKAAGNPDSDPKEPGGDKHAKAAEKESSLKSPGNIITITTTATASSDGASVPAAGNKGESPRDTRKKHTNSRALRTAASNSLNGNGGSAASAPSSSGSCSPSPSTVTLQCPNSASSTVSGNPQAIAPDRMTPTIALQRLPRHIIASIAQNGNGTSATALVHQGAAGGQANHGKPADAPENNVKPAVQSGSAAPPGTSVTPAAVLAPVKPATVVSAHPVTPLIRPAQTQARPAPPAQQRLVTPQLIVRPPQQQTTIQLPPGFTIPPGMVLVRTEMGQLVMVPQQALAQAQNSISPRASTPTSASTFRVTTPQGPRDKHLHREGGLAVPSFALAPPGTGPCVHMRAACGCVAVCHLTERSGTSPLSCVKSAIIQESVPARLLIPEWCWAYPTSHTAALPLSGGIYTRVPLPSPVSTQAIRPAPAAQTKMKTPVAAVVAVTAPQQVQPAMGPQGPLTQMPLAPQTAAAPAPGAPLVSQEMQENVKKCKNFLATLIKLASHNSPSPETSKNVKGLVQDLLDAKIDPEEFTSRLQSELKSSPQPYLVPFLKKSLPALRLSLLSNQQSPIQVHKTGVCPVQTVVGVRPQQPNSTGLLSPGIKRAAGPGAQMRMPVVVTHTVRATGKPSAIQTGKGPAGICIQLSGNQKNKPNDPGGGSFSSRLGVRTHLHPARPARGMRMLRCWRGGVTWPRAYTWAPRVARGREVPGGQCQKGRDDDDINDVASMAGVNLNEESARILATNSELVGTQIRSCKDEAFIPPGLLHRRILETAKRFGVTEVALEAVNFISHATQSRLRTVLEKVSSIAQHRMDSCKEDEWYEQASDVRAQLKFFEQLERMEKQRKDEREREILLRAAKKSWITPDDLQLKTRQRPLGLAPVARSTSVK
ncbi:TFIID subunit 4 RNA polymerase II [Triplophysa tibetana]|uniref:TFIID subunit 4 RNA polymerase II n=1 Tax=Triplophysa tibetana TaxID=1572043 RepID=A0A5A9P296_9TELE|nr:TFIID subunit 4 RNA polymerase II [Triplophysa tibetana]